MLRWLIGKRIDAFEKSWDYDAGYMREILDADPGAAMVMGRLGAMSGYRKGVPPAPWYAAKITAALAADCGPCTQLVVKMAEKGGMKADDIRAVLAGNLDALPEETALAVRFARAVIERDMEAEPLRERAHALWGRTGLVSLAYGIAAAQMYPTIKAGLGHAEACVRVRVGGADMPVLREAA